jgi:pimeloyl-ACP methyl ester carboxylesterase
MKCLSTRLSIIIFTFSTTSIYGQSDAPAYTEHFVKTNGVQLHYLDLGGTGLPLIFLQSYHDDAHEWVEGQHKGFAPRFVQTHRVFAITRRGWGKSSDPGWGFDVPTNGEDVLGFMDALNLKKAVLVGRIPASLEMTWIAEHHPDRVAGLVYWDMPLPTMVDLSDSIALKYVEMAMSLTCDQPNTLNKTMQKATWLPHFLNKQAPSIHIPALWFSRTEAEMNNISSFLWFTVESLVRWAKSKNFDTCDPEAKKYFTELAANEALQIQIKEKLNLENDFVRFTEDFKNAFVPALKIVVIDPPPPRSYKRYLEEYWPNFESDFRYKHISEFLKTIPQ